MQCSAMTEWMARRIGRCKSSGRTIGIVHADGPCVGTARRGVAQQPPFFWEVRSQLPARISGASVGVRILRGQERGQARVWIHALSHLEQAPRRILVDLLAPHGTIPVILDGVVCSARQQFGNLHPVVAKVGVGLPQNLFLGFAPRVLSDRWVKLIDPSATQDGGRLQQCLRPTAGLH